LSLVISGLGKCRSGGLTLRGGTALNDANDVGLPHDQELRTVEFHLGAGPFVEQDAVIGLGIERYELTGFVTAETSKS
jgi:hypothetical protein